MQLRRGKVKLRCVTGKRKKYNVECSNTSSQSKKQQHKATNYGSQITNKKCLCKQDIAKKKINKLEDRITKKTKCLEGKKLSEKRKNENEICPGRETKKYI